MPIPTSLSKTHSYCGPHSETFYDIQLKAKVDIFAGTLPLFCANSCWQFVSVPLPFSNQLKDYLEIQFRIVLKLSLIYEHLACEWGDTVYDIMAILFGIATTGI